MSELVRRAQYGLSDDVYRRAPGLSQSEAKRLKRSPWHLHKLREPRPEGVTDKAPTPQMFAGTLMHCALLQPELFDSKYMIGPECSKNSKQWHAFAEGCERIGAEPITQLQRDQAFAQAASLRALPDVAAILAPGCQCEASLFWTDPGTGVLCKGRLDALRMLGPDPDHERGSIAVLDAKSTDDAGAESFARSVADFLYHFQAAWYTDAAERVFRLPVALFLFAVVEREYPHGARSYVLDEEALDIGRALMTEARELYARCDASGDWPGYPSEPQSLSLPRWYVRKYLNGEI